MTGRTKKDSVLPANFAKEKGRSLEGKDFGTMVGRKRGGLKIPTLQKGRGPRHQKIHRIGGVNFFCPQEDGNGCKRSLELITQGGALKVTSWAKKGAIGDCKAKICRPVESGKRLKNSYPSNLPGNSRSGGSLVNRKVTK